MRVKVRLLASMRELADDRSEVGASAGSIDELIADLERRFPGASSKLCDERGCIRRFIAVFVNDTDIRAMEGQATLLADGDEVTFVPAVAGG